jgi:hypothetical protein
MTDSSRENFAYPSILTVALRNAGAPLSTIKSFEAYWKALPPGIEKRPCPLCYAQGRQGWLHLGKMNGAPTHVQCERCREQFSI